VRRDDDAWVHILSFPYIMEEFPGPLRLHQTHPAVFTHKPQIYWAHHEWIWTSYDRNSSEIHQKLAEASELASIAFCTNKILSAPLNTLHFHRLCSDFQGKKFLFVSRWIDVWNNYWYEQTIDPGSFGGFLGLSNGYIAGYISVQDTGRRPKDCKTSFLNYSSSFVDG